MNREEMFAAMQATRARAMVRPLTIKLWGDKPAFVRPISAEEYGDITDRAKDEKKEDENPTPANKNTLAIVAARVLCDEQGNLTFSEFNEEDMALLLAQAVFVLRKVAEAAGAIGDDSGN